jgi:hypothetical protein
MTTWPSRRAPRTGTERAISLEQAGRIGQYPGSCRRTRHRASCVRPVQGRANGRSRHYHDDGRGRLARGRGGGPAASGFMSAAPRTSARVGRRAGLLNQDDIFLVDSQGRELEGRTGRSVPLAPGRAGAAVRIRALASRAGPGPEGNRLRCGALRPVAGSSGPARDAVGLPSLRRRPPRPVRPRRGGPRDRPAARTEGILGRPFPSETLASGPSGPQRR